MVICTFVPCGLAHGSNNVPVEKCYSFKLVGTTIGSPNLLFIGWEFFYFWLPCYGCHCLSVTTKLPAVSKSSPSIFTTQHASNTERSNIHWLHANNNNSLRSGIVCEGSKWPRSTTERIDLWKYFSCEFVSWIGQWLPGGLVQFSATLLTWWHAINTVVKGLGCNWCQLPQQ